ncbi:MBL fold metallo-hydrolase [Paenibacillus harenae]|uniref:MBL fold metallo-hydrolase n=1 Tax=Paenibacillus harenae TaxID=306543 RepID=UPI0003F4C2FE|nr:MBL fold metallo-hydrolase [Paenibacillus harenae]
MNVKVLASGSEGNCVWIGNDKTGILIDAGLPKTKIEKILLDNDIDPTKLDAVFITHEHKDHCQGLAFADKYKIPIYASEGTLKGLGRLDTGKIVKASGGNIFDALRMSFVMVEAFKVHHNAAEPLGYTVNGNGMKVSVMMDTGRVTDEMIHAMRWSDVYVFECNHDEDMVIDGPYHDSLKQRVLRDHMSNNDAAEALAKLIRGQGERIFLTHMSSTNNMPALALGTVKRALKAKGFIAGQHYQLEVI